MVNSCGKHQEPANAQTGSSVLEDVEAAKSHLQTLVIYKLGVNNIATRVLEYN